jgi:hypothetical protein
LSAFAFKQLLYKYNNLNLDLFTFLLLTTATLINTVTLTTTATLTTTTTLTTTVTLTTTTTLTFYYLCYNIYTAITINL